MFKGKKKKGATYVIDTPKPQWNPKHKLPATQWKPMATPVSDEPADWVYGVAVAGILSLSLGAEPLVNMLLG